MVKWSGSAANTQPRPTAIRPKLNMMLFDLNSGQYQAKLISNV